MKHKLIHNLSVLVLLAFATVLGACSKDEPEAPKPNVSYTVAITLPLTLPQATVQQAEATMVDIETGARTPLKGFVQSDASASPAIFSASGTLPQGTYQVEVKATVQYVVNGQTFTTTATGMGKLALSANNTNVTVALQEQNFQEGMLISEIFFTGTLTSEGKQYAADQYIRITNNGTKTVYADSLAIVESLFNSANKFDYSPDVMADAIAVDAIYMIPGSGSDHPLAPGQSMVLALNAIDHREANPQSMDLSKVDFEFYDESSNPRVLDVDNPAVPNLERWYCYSQTYFILHNTGNKSYALVRLQLPKEKLETLRYTPTYQQVVGDKTFERSAQGYIIPNAWVLDAINLGTAEGRQWSVFASTLDAGWTFVATAANDKTRYGKALIRKMVGGKYSDLNNSSTDFMVDAPTLMKK